MCTRSRKFQTVKTTTQNDYDALIRNKDPSITPSAHCPFLVPSYVPPLCVRSCTSHATAYGLCVVSFPGLCRWRWDSLLPWLGFVLWNTALAVSFPSFPLLPSEMALVAQVRDGTAGDLSTCRQPLPSPPPPPLLAFLGGLFCPTSGTTLDSGYLCLVMFRRRTAPRTRS
jgi:hypothetical protein